MFERFNSQCKCKTGEVEGLLSAIYHNISSDTICGNNVFSTVRCVIMDIERVIPVLFLCTVRSLVLDDPFDLDDK